jgi:hypothetical protein
VTLGTVFGSSSKSMLSVMTSDERWNESIKLMLETCANLSERN